MSSKKDELVSLLKELGELTILDEGSPNAFRVRAYENAVHGLEGRGDEVLDMSESALCKIPGVGKSIAKKIREFVDTGTISKLETLRETFPPEFVELSRIPGLGPKSLLKLRAELDIETVDDLRAAIEDEQLRELPGFGKKSEEKLAHAIERLGLAGKQRRTAIVRAMPLARRIVAALEELPEVERAQYCGSLRRFRETVGDIDITVASTDPAPIMEAFCAMSFVSEVIAHGETKSSVLTAQGLQVDLRVVTPEQFGAAILYFTGSKAHNIKLRQRAMDRGWILNEYALAEKETEEIVASETEEEIYAALELPWIPPPMREDTGEVEKAATDELPETIAEDELRGDLHVHTSLSGDGRSPIDEMVATAAARGYRYMAITDHAENLAINGVSREALLAQRDEDLARLQEDYPKLQLLWGCELNIGPEGDLDYDEEFRMSMDWCVAAVHSYFDLDQAKQTKRLLAAMDDPAVNVIGHLTGRMIGRRPGIQIDVDTVLQKAVDTGTAIEINSSLARLDAATEVLRRARELGVTLVMSTDAHHTDELSRMQWGVQHAARGWVDKTLVANLWSKKKFLAWAQRKRKG